MSLLIGQALAQMTWRRSYGALDDEDGRVVRRVSDDLFIAAGSTGSFGAGSSDIYLVAVDGLGDPLWSRTIGGAGVDVVTDMRVVADGLLLAGYTNGTGNGGYDGILIRTNAIGEVQWQRNYGGADWDFFNDVQQLDDGGLLITGQTYSWGPTGGNAWLLRTDAAGDTLWTRTFGSAAVDEGHAAKPTSDGGFVLAGSTVDVEGDQDVLVVKLDVNGDAEWQFSYGGDSLDVGRDIVQTLDGGFSIVGATRSFSQWVEAYHLKIDQTGGEQWHWNWGQINDQEAYEHWELPTGEFISIGYTKTSGGGGKDMFLLKSAANGDFVFGRTFGGSEDEAGMGLAVLTDGFICAGGTLTYGSGGMDVFLVRTGEDGTTEFESVEESFDPLPVEEYNAGGQPLVFPNPNAGTFSIPSTNGAVRLRLIDMIGRTVEDRILPALTRDVDVDVPSGGYLLRIELGDGRVLKDRILIARP